MGSSSILSLEQTLKDQEEFTQHILNAHNELKKYHDEKPKELYEALYTSCLKGIREGVEAFIEKEQGKSKNLFDHDISKFFYEADIRTPAYKHLINNKTIKKHFNIQSLPSTETFSDEISQIIHDEYRLHAITKSFSFNSNE